MEDIIKQIAKEQMGVHRLEPQNRDALDFHDVSVWDIKAALEAAYKAGQQSATENPA